mgnify:CR=1 FL=1
MQLDEILSEWRKDSEIDRTELGEEALKIPKLHSKYYNIYATERLQLRKLETDFKVLQKLKYEYFSGTLDYEELKDQGWEPNNLKILRADIPQYIDSDKDIIELTLKIAYQKEKVEFLDNAIRTLNTRGYNIRAAIDWEKFKVGM